MPAATSRSAAWAGTAWVSAAACGWGTWTLFLRGRGLPPAWQSVLILAVVGALALPPALLAGRGRPRRRAVWLGVLLSGALDAGNYLFFFAAVDRGPIAAAVLAHYLAPALVALFAPRFLGEALGPRTLPALVASLAGLALLLLGGATAGREALPAAAMGAASAVFYAANTLLSKKLLDEVSSAELLSYHSFVAALLLLPLAGPAPALSRFLFRPLAGAVLLGWGGGLLFLLGMRRIPAQRTAVLTYLEPLVASATGALAFHEPLGPAGLLGGALIVAGGLAIALEPRGEAVSAGPPPPPRP